MRPSSAGSRALGSTPAAAKERGRGSAVRRRQEQPLAGRAVEPDEAGVHEFARGLRNRERLRRIAGCPWRWEPASELECVEGVAARRVVEADERRARERPAESLLQEQAQCSDAERADAQPLDRVRVDAGFDSPAVHTALAETPRQQNDNGLASQSPERERQRTSPTKDRPTGCRRSRERAGAARQAARVHVRTATPSARGSSGLFRRPTQQQGALECTADEEPTAEAAPPPRPPPGGPRARREQTHARPPSAVR